MGDAAVEALEAGAVGAVEVEAGRNYLIVDDNEKLVVIKKALCLLGRRIAVDKYLADNLLLKSKTVSPYTR